MRWMRDARTIRSYERWNGRENPLLEVDSSIIVKVELGAEAPARGLMRPIHFAYACLASTLLLEACSGGSSALPTSIASKPAAHTIAAGLAGPDACPVSRI